MPGLSNRFWIALAILSLQWCLSTVLHADTLSTTADRLQIAINETVAVRVRFDGQTLGDPDFSALKYDWEIIQNQRQSQLAYGGGQSLSFTQWSLTLAPRRKGKLMVPSFSLNGVVSDALEIEVGDARVANAGDQPVFIETELDKSRVYVQEQILLTLRFHTSVMLNNFSATELKITGAQVLKAGESQYQKTIDNRTYTVVETRYAIFPEQSGDLEIPPVRFGGAIPDPRSPLSHPLFGGNSKQILLRSEPLTVSVRPIPADANLDQWLPSKGLSMAQQWSQPVDQLVVGEPVTRTIVISAQSLTGAQLPPLNISEGDGYRLYPDQPSIESQPVKSGIVGTRLESMAIVPTRAGEIHLPPVTVRWWDTISGTVRETVLEGETLKIAAAASEQDSSVAAPATATPAPLMGDSIDGNHQPVWLWLLIGSNLLWLVVAGLFGSFWWRRTRGDTTEPGEASARKQSASETAAFQQVEATARQGPTREFRAAVIDWAGLFWPEVTVRQLQQVAELCQHSELQQQFRLLDRLLFGKFSGEPPSADRITACLRDIRKAGRAKPKAERALKPLYPV